MRSLSSVRFFCQVKLALHLHRLRGLREDARAHRLHRSRDRGQLRRARDVDGMVKLTVRHSLDLGHKGGERPGQRIPEHKRRHEHEDHSEHAGPDGEQVGRRLSRVDELDVRRGEHVDAGAQLAEARTQSVEKLLAGQLLLQEGRPRQWQVCLGELRLRRPATRGSGILADQNEIPT